MLVFFVTRRATDPIESFFETWGACLRSRVHLVHYEDLARAARMPAAATYVFTDLERLTLAGLERAREVADSVARTPAAPRIINHPRRALRRYDLLRLLYERRMNPYQAHRAVPVPTTARLPVFLRNEHAHHAITPLLWTRRDLEQALVRAERDGHDLASLLVVEYQETRDEEGSFRLYGGYMVGDEFVPGILAFSSHWIVKYSTARAPSPGAELAEQRAAAHSRAHEPVLREIARLGGISYGRFDYALHRGRVCLWELNTNPTFLFRREQYAPQTRKDREPIAQALVGAFAKLASGEAGNHPPVQLELPARDEPLVARVPWTQLTGGDDPEQSPAPTGYSARG